MNKKIEDFICYLKTEKKLSDNSLSAYRGDLYEFDRFIGEKGVTDLAEVQNTQVVAYLLNLKHEGKSRATANRKIASLRAFYNLLLQNGQMKDNPTLNIKSPRIERKAIEYLTVEEIDKLLSAPDDTIKGIRDRAMLELLYATGIRVSEITETDVEHINLRMGFVTCTGEHGKARIIPMGRPARAAMEAYIYEARGKMLKDDHRDEPAL
ncbi:MAG: site-specific integrase, partial [Anaerovorax sp.]